LVRNESRVVEEQNEVARRSLASMSLPGAVLALENPGGLPPQIAQIAELIRSEV
jgi:hypothetical protein